MVTWLLTVAHARWCLLTDVFLVVCVGVFFCAPAVCNVLSRSGKTLATGVWEGVSGIVLSPVIGAKNDGVVGFCTGVGKGVLGAVVKPVSAVLDVTHLTIQGAPATLHLSCRLQPVLVPPCAR